MFIAIELSCDRRSDGSCLLVITSVAGKEDDWRSHRLQSALASRNTYSVCVPAPLSIQKRIVSGAPNRRFQSPIHGEHAGKLTSPSSGSSLICREGRVHRTAKNKPACKKEEGSRVPAYQVQPATAGRQLRTPFFRIAPPSSCWEFGKRPSLKGGHCDLDGDGNVMRLFS